MPLTNATPAQGRTGKHCLVINLSGFEYEGIERVAAKVGLTPADLAGCWIRAALRDNYAVASGQGVAK